MLTFRDSKNILEQIFENIRNCGILIQKKMANTAFFFTFQRQFFTLKELKKIFYVLTLRDSKTILGPIPDNISNCGVLIAPADKMTSFLTFT